VTTNQINILTDPRTVTFLDGTLSYGQHPSYVQLQIHDGQSANRVNQLGSNGYVHDDGSDWFVRGQMPNGKNGFRLRIMKGQNVFQGNTLRSEFITEVADLARLVDERGGDYWWGYALMPESDMVDNSGTQYGGRNQIVVGDLHGQNWISGTVSSSGHPMGLMWSGNQLRLRLHAPYTGPSYVYDVRTTPFSNKVISSEVSGGVHGTARWWVLADVPANQMIYVVVRAKLANVASENPRTEVWIKGGNYSSLTKVVDTDEPNTFSRGHRYVLGGMYSWDLSDAWWGNKNTRTSWVKAMAWMRNQDINGLPRLNENVMLSWMDK
jgi:hypothetical protein